MSQSEKLGKLGQAQPHCDRLWGQAVLLFAFAIMVLFALSLAIEPDPISHSANYLALFWLGVGAALCGVEFGWLRLHELGLQARHRYLALSMAIPAFLLALGLWLDRIALDLGLQILSWMGMSVMVSLWGRSLWLEHRRKP